MNKNVKKLVAATVVAGLAVAPVAAQTTTPVAQAAEQAQSKHVVAKFVQNSEGNFVQVTATQDVQAAKVTISVDGKGQHVVNVGNLKKGETKLVPFNVDAKKVGNGFAPKALPKTAAVTEHVTISKTINSHLVRATVSYKFEDSKAAVKPEGKPGNNDGNGKKEEGKPGDRPRFDELVAGGEKPTPTPGKPGEATPAPAPTPTPEPQPAPAPTPDVRHCAPPHRSGSWTARSPSTQAAAVGRALPATAGRYCRPARCDGRRRATDAPAARWWCSCPWCRSRRSRPARSRPAARVRQTTARCRR